MSSAPNHGNAFTLGKGALVSRLFGFVRDMAIAALVGSGWTADALLLALRVPNFARSLLAEGAFAYVLVPAYRELGAPDGERARSFGRSVTCALVCLFGLVALCGAFFSEQFALFLAPGFAARPDVLRLAAGFVGVCLFSLPLVAAAAVSSAALMAKGRFQRPAYASAVFNLTIITAAGAAFFLFGAKDGRVPFALCMGVVAAGAVQWGYLAAPFGGGMRQKLFRTGTIGLKDPAVTRSLRALPGSVAGVGGHLLNAFIASVLASFLAEGSISALHYAERLVGFPLGIIGASMGLAALPDLSRLARAHVAGKNNNAPDTGPSDFTARLVATIRITLFFAMPAAVGTACLAEPLTAAVFGRGAFDQAALARTSAVLLAFVAGLPALAAIRPLLAGLAALGEGKTPARATLAGAAATALFGTLLLPLGAPWGPACATSLAAWVNAAILARALALRGARPLPGFFWSLKVLAACALMAACVLWAASFFPSTAGKAATVPLGVAAYFIAARILRLEEAALFRPAIQALLRKK